MDPRTTATRLGVGLLGLATGTGVVGAHGANDTYYDGHMWDGHMAGDWGHMGGWGGGWWLLHGLFWLVVIVAALGAVYWAVSDRGGDDEDDAVAILRQQYARGELDHEEFEERRRRLEE